MLAGDAGTMRLLNMDTGLVLDAVKDHDRAHPRKILGQSNRVIAQAVQARVNPQLKDPENTLSIPSDGALRMGQG
jgi:hypothetical protein